MDMIIPLLSIFNHKLHNKPKTNAFLTQHALIKGGPSMGIKEAEKV
jgi:hypothetical protein